MKTKPLAISLTGAPRALVAMPAIVVLKSDFAPPDGCTNYKRVQ